MQKIADLYNVPLYSSEPFLCTDNSMMNAWLAWELINEEQDVDITNVNALGLKKLPLGNYILGLINMKSSDLKMVRTQR